MNIKIKQTLLRSQWLILLMVILLISAITAIINPRFLMVNNIMNIFEQIAVLGLVAAGASIIIISGNFDISVGAILGLTCCITAILINEGVNGIAASAAGILVSMLCTLLNGILAILFKAPSFIISLATTSVYTGAALFITKGVIRTVYGEFDFLSKTKVLSIIPLIFVISLIGYVIVHIILKYTQIGRRLFAIGCNEKSAFLAGIRVTGNKLIFFVLNGFFVGVAAVLLLSRVGSALPSSGAGMELQAMGAVVIGGVPISGGKGNIIGTFFGVLLMGLISNVLNILGVNPYLQEIASGAIIIIALGISALRVNLLNKN
ncbi:monosaccharide ABC transporter membrane protein (CUT2 family) [Kineothrix alysoides]|uniref:Monosaccharide ABC transporter membrane protein (CUT2 family) n=1 Tax=Kineothrix alysoides TaxID=1469948 RepID=A0A4R1QT78_9FIRM|nr:ABC transporter permease [Kineothrix alysoides]TCL56283.1 monosaccharide ABC transporter membrane protein (CUT2 family) [Kineothrix alysoides]